MPEDVMNGKHFPDCFIKPSEAGFDMVETSATRFLPRMGFAGGRCLKPVGENVPVILAGQGIWDYFKNSLLPDNLHLKASGK